MSYPSFHPTNRSLPFNNINDMEGREGGGQSPVVGMAATSVPVHSQPQHVVESRRYHVLQHEQLQEPQEREVLCGCFRPIKQCCGCVPLRTGIVTLAVLYLLGAVNCITFLMIRPDSFGLITLCVDSPTEPMDMSYLETFPSSDISDKHPQTADFHSSQKDFERVAEGEQPTVFHMPKKTPIRRAVHTLSTPPMSSHVMDKRRLLGSATSSSSEVGIPPNTINNQPAADNDSRNGNCWDKNDIRRLRASIVGVFFSHVLLGVTMVLGVQLPVTQLRLDILMIPFAQLMIASFVQLLLSGVCFVGGVISLFLIGDPNGYSRSFLSIYMFVMAVLCFLSAVPFMHFAHVVWSYRVH
eukprot:GHVS01098210.1.p1 GENE.GHVS01098210.1~~GHVS01098210.1.p1  ORF type:complete len:354 (+),score=42.98 GHVS01098210.1:104-1165(+)